MLHFSQSRINGADFLTVVDLFDRVVRSRRKVYRNGLQEGDLKVLLFGFGGVKCKCVCFFAWNLELILSRFEDRSSDSVLPCLLLLHRQVRWWTVATRRYLLKFVDLKLYEPCVTTCDQIGCGIYWSGQVTLYMYTISLWLNFRP